MTDRFAYKLPFGATLDGDRTSFRIWAPSADQVSLQLGARALPMHKVAGDWFEVSAPCPAGTPYQFAMPDGLTVPDPASRAQADDVHGPSLVVDPTAYAWQHGDWTGRPWHEAVVYELHVGACGGFEGVRKQLPRLQALGVTVIELMPINDFPGKHNWGYDGVLPYAPDTAYGTPDQLKALIDAAHGLGLSIMLDVVYNHFGPDGAYLHAYAKEFFRDDIKTPWGASIDFRRQSVQDYFIQNARYWLEEYRFDGLRFDAVHAIQDPGFLDLMAREIRAGVEPGRHVHLVMEHEGNAARHLRTGPDAPGFDAQWTDDVHQCLHVLLTGETEGYYEDYDNPIGRLARCMAEGFAYQGEMSKHGGKPRGERSGHLPSTAFVICLQNHDQTGNRALGERLTVLAHPDALRAAQALLLLAPFIPLLFMGEEFDSKQPFLFFTDHNHDLAELVRIGRREEFKHFAAFKDPARRDAIPDPNDPATFQASVPDFHRAEQDSGFYHQLLATRFEHVVPGIPGCRTAGVDTLGEMALVARWQLGDGKLLAIACNFGEAAVSMPAAEGALIHEAPGAWTEAGAGRLPGRTTVAWLAHPGG